MLRADRVIRFLLIHFRLIVLNNVIYFLDLDNTAFQCRPFFLIIFALVTEVQNFVICEEWKLSKFTDFGHFSWVCMLIS